MMYSVKQWVFGYIAECVPLWSSPHDFLWCYLALYLQLTGQ